MESFLNPAKVLKKIKLRDDMTAADFGSGSGGWVIPLAKELEAGKVYALDVLQEPLSALRAKAKLFGISNIETMLADVEKETEIPAKSCDLVLMTNLLFQCEDKKGVFREARRVLKKRGKILVLDWKKEAPFGPKEGRVLPEEIKKIGNEFGFKEKKSGTGEFEAGPYHFGMILANAA